MHWIEWYNSLNKPSWTPSPSTIGLIWTILYSIIAVGFGFVFVKTFQGNVHRIVAVPIAINLVASLMLMPIFSELRNLPLALEDILIVWTTVIWCIVVIWRNFKWLAIAQVPYFDWVSIATVLQLSITRRNWGKS